MITPARSIRSLAACACAALLAAFASHALGADSKCKLVRIAEWPVRLQGNLPLIEGAIDGKKIGILLDTGAFASLVTKDAAKRLDLNTKVTGDVAIGFGGESRILVARLGELRIGDAVRTNLRVRVIGERPIRGVDFILGDDFFKNIELEFDYAKGVIRLFQAQDCKGAALAYCRGGRSSLLPPGSAATTEAATATAATAPADVSSTRRRDRCRSVLGADRVRRAGIVRAGARVATIASATDTQVTDAVVAAVIIANPSTVRSSVAISPSTRPRWLE